MPPANKKKPSTSGSAEERKASAKDEEGAVSDQLKRKQPKKSNSEVMETEPTAPATAPTPTPVQTMEETVLPAEYLVYIKGVNWDIIKQVKTAQVMWANELSEKIGHIDCYKPTNNCIRVHCMSAEQQQLLLTTTQLLDKPVEVTKPWSPAEKIRKHEKQRASRPPRYNKVVIMGVADDWSDGDIQSQTEADYARRIKRRVNGELIETSAVILGYINDPPEAVELGYRIYRTRLYVEQPIQCHQCLRWGHKKDRCRGQQRCPRCSGEHKFDDCPDKDDRSHAKCANCGDSHSATYKGCPKYDTARTVVRKATTDKLTYAEAARSLRKEQQPLPTMVKTTMDETAVELKKEVECIVETKIEQTVLDNDKKIQQMKDSIMREVTAILDASLRELKNQLMEFIKSMTRPAGPAMATQKPQQQSETSKPGPSQGPPQTTSATAAKSSSSTTVIKHVSSK